MMRPIWPILSLLLLLIISPPVSAKERPASGDCVVCDGPAGVQAIVEQFKGRWVTICPGKCGEHWNANPDQFFLKLQSNGALFDENSISQETASDGLLYLVCYFLIGLMFGAMCAYVALTNGHNPVFWFLAGFLVNILALIVILLKDHGDLSQLPAGVPPGLSKIPATYDPVSCPGCGRENHPSAGHCSACGAALDPTVNSEVSRLSDQALD